MRSSSTLVFYSLCLFCFKDIAPSFFPCLSLPVSYTISLSLSFVLLSLFLTYFLSLIVSLYLIHSAPFLYYLTLFIYFSLYLYFSLSFSFLQFAPQDAEGRLILISCPPIVEPFTTRLEIRQRLKLNRDST